MDEPRRPHWCAPLALTCLLAAAASPAYAQRPRPVKAADAWHTMYLAGKLDLASPRIKQNSPGVRFGVVSPAKARGIGHLDELALICERLARHPDAEAIEALLTIAGVGLDTRGSYDVELRPTTVREIGERFIDEIDDDSVWAIIDAYAEEIPKGETLAAAKCGAAILALARRQDEVHRPRIEAGLRADSLAVRLAAAAAAEASGLRTVLPALCTVTRETKDDSARVANLVALLGLVNQHREEIADDDRRAIANAGIASLGKGTWHSDLAAVNLLERVRSARAIPGLIDTLATQVERGRSKDPDRFSGVLRGRTHEVLMSLTGAVIPAEQVDEWRAWWDEARNGFVMAEPKTTPDGEGRTTTGDFFGIPVRGSRVLFVIDISGSMAEAWRGQGTRRERGLTKLDVAKRELLKAVARLTPDCAFNLVWFGDDAHVWQRDMAEATDKVRKRFEKLVVELEVDGNTNLWQGLQDGLRLEAIVRGGRYTVDYDELFVLSDGLPTRGIVQRPSEILSLVADTNRQSRLTIHTVYVSGDPRMEKRMAEALGMSGSEFMRRLAEENGGEAVAF